MVAQEEGNVDKAVVHGALKFTNFSPAEAEWRQMMKTRIMAQLTYGSKNG